MSYGGLLMRSGVITCCYSFFYFSAALSPRAHEK
jgi:hypothetical protein